MSPQEELDRSGLVLERRVHRESYQHRTNHPRIQRQALRSNSRSSQVVGAYLEDAQAYRLFLKKLGWTTAEYRANREIKNFLCIKTWREGEGNERIRKIHSLLHFTGCMNWRLPCSVPADSQRSSTGTFARFLESQSHAAYEIHLPVV